MVKIITKDRGSDINMDIEESKILLKDFQKGKIEKDKLETYKGGYKLGYFYTVGIQEAIETVLEELENKQDDINILQAQRDSIEYQFKQAKSELEKKEAIIKYLINDLYDLAVAINEEYRVEEYLLNKETIKEYYLNRKEE